MHIITAARLYHLSEEARFWLDDGIRCASGLVCTRDLRREFLRDLYGSLYTAESDDHWYGYDIGAAGSCSADRIKINDIWVVDAALESMIH